jgi:hypothetical protein
MSLFADLTSNVHNRSFTDDEIRAMPKQIIRYIATYNARAVVVPEGAEVILRGRVPTAADKNAATKIHSEGPARVTSHIRPDSFLTTNGGSVHYEPEKVSLHSLNGSVQVRSNSAIPAPFGTSEKHSNVQAVAAVAAQLVCVDSGRWVTNVPINTWSKVLKRDGGMSAGGMIEFAETVCVVLNSSRTWKVMDSITKSACTGLEALSFIRQEFDQLTDDEYNLVNTRLVFKLLCPFEYDQGEWYERIYDDDRLIVPTTSYKPVQVSEACLAQIRKEGMTQAFWYLGGYAPELQLPPNQGKFKETLDRYQKMMEAQVGNNSCTALLAGMRGFSGMTDDFGKRIQFILAATLAMWKKNEQVDILLSTVGDLLMLKSSLNKWVRYIEEKKLEGWSKDVKFILPSALDSSKVPQIMRDDCIVGPRHGTVLIIYNLATLPTSTEKGQVPDYFECAKSLIPEVWKGNKIVAYVPIYDDYFFPAKEGEDVQLTSARLKERFKGAYVYEFGTSSSFRGLVSTFPDLSLIGYGYRKVSGKYLMTEPESLFDQPLVKVPDFGAWLKKVSTDCSIQMVAWLRPVSRYSPISNLPFMSRKGVTLTLSAIETEEGILLGNVERVENPTGRRGKKIGQAPVVAATTTLSSTVTTTTTTSSMTQTSTSPAILISTATATPAVRRLIGGGNSSRVPEPEEPPLVTVPQEVPDGEL